MQAQPRVDSHRKPAEGRNRYITVAHTEGRNRYITVAHTGGRSGTPVAATNELGCADRRSWLVQKEYLVPCANDLLGPIAVVEVPIDDRHAATWTGSERGAT